MILDFPDKARRDPPRPRYTARDLAFLAALQAGFESIAAHAAAESPRAAAGAEAPTTSR